MAEEREGERREGCVWGVAIDRALSKWPESDINGQVAIM